MALDGTVFELNLDGSGYNTLYSFNLANNYDFEGGSGQSDLILNNNIIYGMLPKAANNSGQVFSLSTTSGTFSTLTAFTGDLGGPLAGVILRSNMVYGAASGGGPSSAGGIFSVQVDGSQYQVLYYFTNSPDGQTPKTSLLLVSNVLYGTTYQGGRSSWGTVFRINTDGTGYQHLHDFTNSLEGVYPSTGLVMAGNTLFGGTFEGGEFGSGVLYKINMDGSAFQVVLNFAGTNGYDPQELLAAGNKIYGTTYVGGSSANGNGTVFQVNTDGTGMTVLHNFANSPDGATPEARLTLIGNSLYGTTSAGGDLGAGTIFKVDLSSLLSPTLNLRQVGSQVVLSWSNPSYALQSAPLVTGTYTNIPGATSPYTNTITGKQQFFRLVGN